MLRVVRSRCWHVGLLWWLWAAPVCGVIEIVEEQRCHDADFRLTCRELGTHIAILDGWYTSLEDYHRNYTDANVTNTTINTENDSELNKVYVYSSPNHNGFYVPLNHSNFEKENATEWPVFSNDTKINETMVNEWLSDSVLSVDSVGEVNVSQGCSGLEYSRSFASWREGDKRKRKVVRDTSVNLRAPLSYRCTGVNHCSFVLSEDYPQMDSWSPGVVYIKYACFDDSLSVHYCNREVLIADWGPSSEGYIRTPGYPHFYVEGECRWRLRAAPEQRIRVTFLDISLRTIGPWEDNCTDFVTARDTDGESLLSSCEQVALPLRITSQTNSVDIAVDARSEGAYPKRGVLIHYKSINCVTLAAPSDGYLVYRNEDVAHYMCNINYVFADTRERSRLIWCYDENRWNDTVPFCVEETTPGPVENNSAADGSDKENKLASANMIVDIVIPSLLIAALFIGNAFIVLIIYKYRKRKTDDCDEDLNMIPVSINGNIHSAGNAV